MEKPQTTHPSASHVSIPVWKASFADIKETVYSEYSKAIIDYPLTKLESTTTEKHSSL
jgi:hypothetical protein